MLKIYNNQEQQIQELEEQLQDFVDERPKPIAKIDLERAAQFFVDEYDDDLLLSTQEITDLVEDVWDKFLKKIAAPEVTPEEAVALKAVAAGEYCLTEEEMDEDYHVNMAVMAGETMAEISFIEEEIAVKTRELQEISHQLELLNMNLLLEKEKLDGVKLVLSVIEKGGIEYLRKKTEYQETITLEN